MDLTKFFKPKQSAGAKLPQKGIHSFFKPAAAKKTKAVVPVKQIETPAVAKPLSKVEELVQIAKPSRPSDAVEAPEEPAPASQAEQAEAGPVEEGEGEDEDDEPLLIGGAELRVGDLVWAKFESDPWWPSHLSADPETGSWKDDGARSCRVIFFGEDTEAWIPHRKIKPFLENLDTYRHSTADNFQEGVQEALEHIGRADLIEVKGPEPTCSAVRQRPRRVTAAARQAEEASKLLADVRKRGRLSKKKAALDKDEDEEDLGLSDLESEPDDDDDSDGSESEFGGDEDEDEDEDDDDVSEGEQEEPPSSAEDPSEESDFSDEDEAPRKRKRAPAKRKPAAAKKQKQPAARGEEQEEFAEEQEEEQEVAAKPTRGASLDGVLSGLACKSESSPSPRAGAATSATPAIKKAGAAAAGKVADAAGDGDSGEWRALAAKGEWSKARTMRLQQWACTLTLQDCENL